MKKRNRIIALLLAMMILMTNVVTVHAEQKACVDGDGYRIVYVVTSQWNNGYLGEITIKIRGRRR